MKSVMISIRPEWVMKILNEEKTVEIRKTAPKIETPFKCYIYCTLGKEPLSYSDYCKSDTPDWVGCFAVNGKVVAEFICDRIFPIKVFNNGTIQDWNWNGLEKSCVPYDDIVMYIGNNRNGYGWHISDLKIYDKPKELCEFTKYSEDDIRPCQNGDECQYEYYDYTEDCVACGIDFDGENCPFVKLQRPPQSWCYVVERKDDT